MMPAQRVADDLDLIAHSFGYRRSTLYLLFSAGSCL